MYRDGADPQYPQCFKQKAQMSNDVHKLWFNYKASISDLPFSLACHIHSTSSGWSDIAKVSSGGFKGGGASNVFLHTYLHKSIKWLYSSGMQQQQPGTVTHSHISFLLISRRLSRYCLGLELLRFGLPAWHTWPEVGVAAQKFSNALRVPVAQPPFWNF